jgi:hypothetical protein
MLRSAAIMPDIPPVMKICSVVKVMAEVETMPVMHTSAIMTEQSARIAVATKHVQV